jgi:flagellar protein FliT
VSALALYESMSELSSEMVNAAQANDWDRLTQLESQVTHLRQTLERAEPVSQPLTVIAGDERKRRASLIKKILADDREVRRHTEPWMESVRELLGGQVRGRAMRSAYGAIQE